MDVAGLCSGLSFCTAVMACLWVAVCPLPSTPELAKLSEELKTLKASMNAMMLMNLSFDSLEDMVAAHTDELAEQQRRHAKEVQALENRIEKLTSEVASRLGRHRVFFMLQPVLGAFPGHVVGTRWYPCPSVHPFGRCSQRFLHCGPCVCATAVFQLSAFRDQATSVTMIDFRPAKHVATHDWGIQCAIEEHLGVGPAIVRGIARPVCLVWSRLRKPAIWGAAPPDLSHLKDCTVAFDRHCPPPTLRLTLVPTSRDSPPCTCKAAWALCRQRQQLRGKPWTGTATVTATATVTGTTTALAAAAMVAATATVTAATSSRSPVHCRPRPCTATAATHPARTRHTGRRRR